MNVRHHKDKSQNVLRLAKRNPNVHWLVSLSELVIVNLKLHLQKKKKDGEKKTKPSQSLHQPGSGYLGKQNLEKCFHAQMETCYDYVQHATDGSFPES